MSLPCTLCINPKAKQINRDLVEYVSQRGVAGRYGVSKSAVDRHSKNCLPRLVKQMQSREARRAQSLTDQLEELAATTEEILQNAKESGDGELALKAIDRRHKQVELHAKLAGEFKQDAPNPMTLEQKAELFNQLVGKAETKLLGEAQVIDSVQ